MVPFKPLKEMNITVVGIGLMGGSILKSLRRMRGCQRTIAALDIDNEILRKVKSQKLADIVTNDAEMALKNADMVVIALYPKQAVAFIKANAEYFNSGAIITDICGVKREVLDSVPQVLPKDVYFVGGHPMAGREHMGFDYAIPELFDGCKYILTGGDASAVAHVEGFAKCLGAGKVVSADPEKHDELIAYTSQLPHALAVSYMIRSGLRGVEDFSAGSFRDFTRIAMINDEMWSELFLENKDKLIAEIEGLSEELLKMRDMLGNNQKQALKDMMKSAAQMREDIVE